MLTLASRILIFCLCLAQLLAGVFLVVWGSLMNNTPYDRHLKDVVFNYNSTEPLATDKSNLRAWVWSVYWSMYGLSIGALLIAVVGLIGAANRRKPALATFLVVLCPLILLEIGGAVAVWTRRGQLRRLIYSFCNDMYIVDSEFDIRVVQTTYSCCGTLQGLWRCDGTPPCDVTVFDRVDNTQMIAGLILIPVVLLQLLLAALSAVVLRFEPKIENGRKSINQ